MVNNQDFGKRIQKIMDHYAISASSFADYMGVGRSSISHILSGRNKPSLDFVMKIIEAYTDVDLHWLLYGKGTFPKSEIKDIEKEVIRTKSLQNDSQIVSPPIISETKNDLFSQPDHEKSIIKDGSDSIEKILPSFSSDNTIDRIVIFYADGSFKSYQTKKS